MIHIWHESLDRAAIVRRSREGDTTIDPSQGDDQFQIFLAKIKLALEGADGTTLALIINRTTATHRPSFTLKISVALPGGLAPLMWSVQLAAASQTVFRDQFTVPLVQARCVGTQEMASLVKVLKDKDHVIQKLMDKLESQNKDFHDLFPQPGGRVRKVDRRQAEERVKGLGVFDVDVWRKDLGLHPLQDVTQLVGQVFAGEETSEVSDNDGPKSDVSEDWWNKLRGVTVSLGSGKISTDGSIDETNNINKAAMRKEDAVDDEDDAFQVQHLAHKEVGLDNDESTDGEDLDAPSQRSKIHDSYPIELTQASPPKPKHSRGKLGGKKVPTRPKSPTKDDGSTEDEDDLPHKPATRLTRKAKPIIDDDQSTTEEAASPKRSPKRKSISPAPRNTTLKPIRKLGKIGGKREVPLPPEPETESEMEAPSPVPVPVASPKPKKAKLGKIGEKEKAVKFSQPESEATPEPATQSPSKKKKLGVIGGHKRDTEDTLAEVTMKVEAETQDRGRIKERTKTPEPELRETSVERASRRARELREELEEKARAAPKKKKRKF